MNKDALAKMLAMWTLLGCLSLPFLGFIIWFWLRLAGSPLRLVLILVVLAVLAVVILWAYREVSIAQARNAALRTHMEQVEERVRHKLLESDQSRPTSDPQFREFVRKLFLDELLDGQRIPGLPNSPYWNRALLIAEIEPRLGNLIGMLRPKETGGETGGHST